MRKIKNTGIVIASGIVLILTSMSTVVGDNVLPTNNETVNIRGILPQPLARDTWSEIQKLLASDGTAGDRFGYTVSLDGDTALIGAGDDDDNGMDSGSAYVFTRSGMTWTQQAKLLPSDGATDDRFGYAVSLDGDTALIGACLDDDNGGSSGSAYVFTRSGTTWTQQQKLLPSDGASGDWFGRFVSLNGDTALIGSDCDDDNGEDSGSAYVFTRTGITWTQQAKLLPLDGSTWDIFGWSVSLDGDTALIGAGNDDDNGYNSGSAYVFTRSGMTWTQQAKLLPSDGEQEDWFSWSVSLDGDTALIGAYLDDDNGGSSGSAYVFTRSGTTWTQQQKLLASDGAFFDHFGCSVSLDVDTALIGAYDDGDNGDFSGSAYMFMSNYPPYIPHDPSPVNNSINVSIDQYLSWIGGDPNNDSVTYDIYCGTSLTPPKVSSNQSSTFYYPPEDLDYNTVYYWKIVSWDSHGLSAEGPIWQFTTKAADLEIDITGGFGVHAMITNKETKNINNVEWQLHVDGGLFGKIDRTVNGTIDLAAGESKTASTGIFFGLGPINIAARADEKETTATGILLLFFILGIK